MSKKIKILHIINNLEIGGAEKILVLLLSELSKRENIEIYLVLLEGHGSLVKNLPAMVHLKKFNYHLFSPRFINRFFPDFRFGLLRYVREIKPDIIHGHLIKGEDFAKVLGALTKTPVVTTLHDTIIKPSYKTRLLNQFVVKAVGVSNIVADYLKSAYGYEDSKIEVIPNAIETELFEKGKKKFDINKPVFLYIGRLLESKGIEDAIRGLAKLKVDYPTIEFLVFGKAVFGTYQEHLDKIVLENHWDFVKFMGRTDDVPAALGEGDIFVLPSQTEGFAISVLEAAAASKPVIATNTGAINLLVKNGESGIYVEWNRPDHIYQAAKKILDENLVEAYGKRAEEIAKKSYDINKISEMYVKLYQKILLDR